MKANWMTPCQRRSLPPTPLQSKPQGPVAMSLPLMLPTSGKRSIRPWETGWQSNPPLRPTNGNWFLSLVWVSAKMNPKPRSPSRKQRLSVPIPSGKQKPTVLTPLGGRSLLINSHQGGRGSGSFSSQFHSTVTHQGHSTSWRRGCQRIESGSTQLSLHLPSCPGSQSSWILWHAASLLLSVIGTHPNISSFQYPPRSVPLPTRACPQGFLPSCAWALT